MKISVDIYTLAERFGDFKAVEILKEAGFDAIDYAYYYNKDCEEILGENYIGYAKNLRTHLDSVGIACNQAHGPVGFTYGAKTDMTDPMFRSTVRAMESASILGAKNIVVHAASVPWGVDIEEYNVVIYKSLIPYCEKFGINIAIENLFERDKIRKRFNSKLGTPEALNRVIEKVDSPYAVACVDVGHAALTCCEPENFIRGVKPEFLKAVHIQDNDYLEDRHMLPYGGNLNWENIMTALKDVGYDGWLNLEIIKWVQKYPDELLPEAMKFAATTARHLASIYCKQ